jgi:tetratricopeptide (TPR) repeat protein
MTAKCKMQSFTVKPKKRCEVRKSKLKSKIFGVHTNRLEQLFSFLEENPQDPFLIYALALEYGKMHDFAKMREYFEALMLNFPSYLPTYYHAGKLYEELGEVALAKQTFEQGIELAKSQKDDFALRELNGAYQMFMMDYE